MPTTLILDCRFTFESFYAITQKSEGINKVAFPVPLRPIRTVTASRSTETSPRL